MKKPLLALVILLSTLTISGQTTKKTGLTAGIQGNQFGIGVPVRLTESFTLIPNLAVAYIQENSTDIAAGLAARFYLMQAKVSPFFTLRGGIGYNAPFDDPETDIEYSSKTDIFGGIGLGGEYFIDENFSIGIEAQGNITKSDDGSFRFGNPGNINFNTGTMISATVYF